MQELANRVVSRRQLQLKKPPSEMQMEDKTYPRRPTFAVDIQIHGTTRCRPLGSAHELPDGGACSLGGSACPMQCRVARTHYNAGWFVYSGWQGFVTMEISPSGTIHIDATTVRNAPKPAEKQLGTLGKQVKSFITMAMSKKRGP